MQPTTNQLIREYRDYVARFIEKLKHRAVNGDQQANDYLASQFNLYPFKPRSKQHEQQRQQCPTRTRYVPGSTTNQPQQPRC